MVRPAGLDDLETLVEGNLALARETEAIDLDEPLVRRGVRAVLTGEAPGAYRVLEEEGKVVAQLMLTYEWSDWRSALVWWIQSVYVWPSARRRGFYTRLYEAVSEEARAEGAAGLRLYVEVENRVAQRTYEALGMNGARYRLFETMFGDH